MEKQKNNPNNENDKNLQEEELQNLQNKDENSVNNSTYTQQNNNQVDLGNKQLESQDDSDGAKPKKPFKYPVVSRWNCIKIIIYCLIVGCTLFVPIGFNPIVFAYQGAPIIGNGQIATLQVNFANGFASLLGLEAVLAQPLSMIMQYCTLAFYGILVANIFFSLVLCFLPFNGVRIVFRIFSIIFGIAMLALGFLYLTSFIGFFGYIISTATDTTSILNNFGTMFLNSGVIFYILCAVFTFASVKRQFKWFAKRPY